MKTRAELTAYAEEHDIEIVFYDPPQYFDHAIVGLITGYHQEPAVLYDQDKVLEAMAADMGEEGAREWFDFNTIGAWVGDATPRFMVTIE
jgi:hypothetical protein